ncbi:galectin-4-like isoform X2 [Ascaphus truei]|uniref:galectin-4-like isoform X2 n=1 Tax=Ascaphus truei TaxID=8439 RepID=UPI003F59846D
MAFIPAPGYQPVYNPAIPFTSPFHGGLRQGMSVYIQGTIPRHISKFNVNFLCGQYDGADVAFHFNPRFDGKDRVIFNSFLGGSWMKEEKKKDSFPFKKGKPFELVFIVNSSCFQVNINGSPFHEYCHRIPVQRVESLKVEGDVIIQSLNIIGGGGGMGGGPMPIPTFPSGGGPMPIPTFPSGGGVRPIPSYPSGNLPVMGQPIYNPGVPYYGNIYGGLSSKRTVVVRGLIPEGAQRFHMNFKVQSSNEIAFHFNPRLTEACVVRNSFLGGSWGPEERDMPYNAFIPGQYFDLSIRCGNYRFKVYVNGQNLCDFAHRMQAFQRIDGLEIGGDVVLSYVQF